MEQKLLCGYLEVATYLDCSYMTIYRMGQRNELPMPLNQGKKKIWITGQIEPLREKINTNQKYTSRHVYNSGKV